MQPCYYFLNRNKNGDGFQELQRGEIFVDKTGLIEEINSRISTKFVPGPKGHGGKNLL